MGGAKSRAEGAFGICAGEVGGRFPRSSQMPPCPGGCLSREACFMAELQISSCAPVALDAQKDGVVRLPAFQRRGCLSLCHASCLA